MGFAHAAPQVLVVLSESGGAYREVTETLRTALREQGAVNTLSTVQVDELSNNVVAEADILVAVGVRAMEALAQDSIVAGNRPTLNILVPRQNFESLRARLKLDTRMFTAIYLDQPLSRHLRLIKQILPSRSRVGVVLSVATQERIKTLQHAAREQHWFSAAKSRDYPKIRRIHWPAPIDVQSLTRDHAAIALNPISGYSQNAWPIPRRLKPQAPVRETIPCL